MRLWSLDGGPDAVRRDRRGDLQENAHKSARGRGAPCFLRRWGRESVDGGGGRAAGTGTRPWRSPPLPWPWRPGVRATSSSSSLRWAAWSRVGHAV